MPLPCFITGDSQQIAGVFHTRLRAENPPILAQDGPQMGPRFPDIARCVLNAMNCPSELAHRSKFIPWKIAHENNYCITSLAPHVSCINQKTFPGFLARPNPSF